MSAPTPPPGFRFDAFADARMGRSLFELSAEEWLVPERPRAAVEDHPCEGGAHCCCCAPGERCCDCGEIMPTTERGERV